MIWVLQGVEEAGLAALLGAAVGHAVAHLDRGGGDLAGAGEVAGLGLEALDGRPGDEHHLGGEGPVAHGDQLDRVGLLLGGRVLLGVHVLKDVLFVDPQSLTGLRLDSGQGEEDGRRYRGQKAGPEASHADFLLIPAVTTPMPPD
jgi:hypothetical protein